MSGTSRPSFSPSSPRWRSSSKISSPSSSGIPVSSPITPRIGGTQARQFSGGSHGTVELVVPRGGAEVPQDRVLSARQEREADVLVALPRPDRGARQVAQVVRVEEQERPEVGGVESGLRPGHPVAAQPVEIDPLLPVHRHRRPARGNVHHSALLPARVQRFCTTPVCESNRGERPRSPAGRCWLLAAQPAARSGWFARNRCSGS